MHELDYAILIAYGLAMLAVGVHFHGRQRGLDEYFVGGRDMGATHIGLSVVATDVGGGFSIGLGSVAFALWVPTVIESILLAYSFLVGGLFVPTLAALFWRRASGGAAFASILAGGGSTVVLTLTRWLPDVEPVFVGLSSSALVLVALTLLRPTPAGAR